MNDQNKKNRIRLGRVLLVPLIVLIVFSSWLIIQVYRDNEYLKSVEDRTAEFQRQYNDYLIEHKNDLLIKEIVEKADQLAGHFDYQGALVVLKENPDIQTHKIIVEKTAQIQKGLDAMVPYTASVRHLFFHNLIIDPKVAFGPTSHDPIGYASWDITVDEFKGIIQQMYDRGFMLVDFYDVYEIKDGKVLRKEIRVPVGKIPFILSVDDVSYADPKPIDGFARGMALKDGEIFTRVLSSNGETLTQDGDIVPILESFITDHPDFSFKKARGILALSGNAGTFGYRLTNNEEIQAAKQLALALKDKGWIFASHSFSHQAGEYYSATSDPTKIKDDLTKWNNQIGAIVGDTPLFVAPFGIKLTGDSLQVVKDFGYSAYFIIDRRGDATIREGMTFLARVDIDGVSMTKDAAYLTSTFFDVRSILDLYRP